VAQVTNPDESLRVVPAPASRAPGDPTLIVGKGSATTVGEEQAAPVTARIEWLDGEHAILAEEPSAGAWPDPIRTRVMLGPVRRRTSDGIVIREVVVDGWHVEVELELELRASLRDRARRGVPAIGPGGPIEILAQLPGRIVGLSVGPGDAVVAGQQLLVIEAMKMHNELRAPRAATVERVAVAVGDGVELGDLLVVLR
jgi:biotin carboxyl carrier protein